MAVCQNLVPLVNIKIAGKWMFIPLKMVSIGIDPYPYKNEPWLPFGVYTGILHVQTHKKWKKNVLYQEKQAFTVRCQETINNNGEKDKSKGFKREDSKHHQQQYSAGLLKKKLG